MSNPLRLIRGNKYIIIKEFLDYDKIIHPVGESWIFKETHFLPYDDGLTLHVEKDNSQEETIYRLQWRQEEQAAIIENFSEFVMTV